MANMNEMITMIVLLVLIAFVGAAGSIALSSFQDNAALDLATTAVTGEAVTYVNNSYVGLAQGATAKLSCTTVVDSNGTLVSPGNYTCSRGLGIDILNVGGWTSGATTAITVNYTYAEGDVTFNATGNGLLAEVNLSNQLATIGTIIGIAVLIGIIISAFAFARS